MGNSDMAMFGKGASFASPSNWADRLQIIGAALKDASPESTGDNLLKVQSVLGSRQQDAAKQQFLSLLQGKLGPQYDAGGPAPAVEAQRGMFGGSAPSGVEDPSSAISGAVSGMAPGPAAQPPAPYAYTPPQRTSDGLSIDSPELPQLTIMAQQAGVPIKDLLEVLKANQADMAQDSAGGFYNKHNPGLTGTRTANRTAVADTIIDLNDPANTNRVVPEAPTKGAMPIYDNQGHAVDWSMPVGALDALGRVSRATQRGQTMGTVFNRPNGDGTTTPTLGETMFGEQGGAPGGRGGGGAGRTQSPADAAAAKIEAEAAAGARVDLPRLTQTSNQAIELIDGMLKHPSLDARTGMTGLLPAFPGTRDAGFDAMAEQIHGKTFLEAFQSLKGAGQITEIEGAKATAAIARLNRAQSATDYKTALKDLRTVISTGMARAQRQAGGSRPAAGPAMQGKGFKIISVE